jgi:hypothetical protein
MAKRKLDKLSPQEQELLKQAQAICDMAKSEGWVSVVSFIQGSISFPDPKSYLSREEIILPYTEAYGASEIVRKLFQFVNSQESIVKSLTDKLDMDQDIPNFKIGE